MFQSIGKVLSVKPISTGLQRSLTAAMIVAKATECSQGRWQATLFRNGRLTIVAPSPITAQELVLQKLTIISQLNTALGEAVIKELIVKS